MLSGSRKCTFLVTLPSLSSMPAVEYSKQFITSVVVGKDVVPRIGLHQMESLRADLINAIKRSKDPKVREILLVGFFFCNVLFLLTFHFSLSVENNSM